MECSKLLEIDMRAWHSPSSSACLVLSGAPVTPVLINPQTHCYSNQIWLHISDSKLHWNMTWTNTFWTHIVQDLFFLKCKLHIHQIMGHLLHISSILNWEEMGNPQISFFYIQVWWTKKRWNPHTFLCLELLHSSPPEKVTLWAIMVHITVLVFKSH